ncbi:MAG TPA: DUF3443 family protein [Acidobacteriaceae bacterium]|nr:DUF3443 family protein [Acidobacteriaceae bacterium]
MRRISFFFCLLVSAGLAAGCGGSSGTGTTGGSGGSGSGGSGSGGSGGTGGSGTNVVALTVNGGPTVNQTGGVNYENAAFASATLCAPGSTSNCVTIGGLLVDTGSVGLRVFQSEVSSLNLPSVNAANGSAAYNCVNFVDGSYLWGPVQQADVSMGGETASKASIQVISDSNTGVPSSCSNGGSDNENTAAKLGANGILGVGSEPTDCYYDGGSACDPSSGVTPIPDVYYTCPGGSCAASYVAVANQVVNPVALFPTDNNGVIVELPAVSGTSEASLTGSLVFGIGTESNNALPNTATVFTLNCDEFTTVFDGTSLPSNLSQNCSGGSFIDSGSNGLYFPNETNLPECGNTAAGNFTGFYCPTNSDSLSATNEGQNGSSKQTSFTVDNAESLFSGSSASDSVFPGLAGLQPTGYGFDWGLPFFYGVNVYSSIDGQSVPSGAPAAPWWAY